MNAALRHLQSLPAMLRTMAAVFMLLAGLLAQPAPAQAQDVGQRYLVHWSADEFSYPATVVEVRGNRYFVQFDDGDREWTTRERIFADDLRAGSRVFANWQRRGVYYPGVITRRNGTSIHITYDDGDQEDTSIGVVRVIR